MDFARTRTALAAAVLGLCLLFVACASDDEGGPAGPPMPSPHDAARELLKYVNIAPSALVSFVGPVRPGSSLIPVETDSSGLAAPQQAGTYYLFFINDWPDERYVHPVRYAWVDLDSRAYAVSPQEWWPRLVVPGGPENEPFRLIESFTESGILFYYGTGGSAGLPATFLVRPTGGR